MDVSLLFYIFAVQNKNIIIMLLNRYKIVIITWVIILIISFVTITNVYVNCFFIMLSIICLLGIISYISFNENSVEKEFMKKLTNI